MIERSLDARDGIIVVRGSGVWSRVDVDRHYEALRTMIATRRARGLPIRILSDVIRAERQDAAIEGYIRTQIARTYLAGDRVAILVADGADQMHVRGLLGDADVATFCSPIAAEMWLMADGVERPG